MNITEGYKIEDPVTYQKKCHYCGSLITVERKLMNFKGPTFARCSCGHEVQFTDDIGRCPADVSFFFANKESL